MTRKKSDPWRSKLNKAGIVWSLSYLLLGFVLKEYVNTVFVKNLDRQNIEVKDMITKVTPLNIWLWTTTVEVENGYYSSFYSVFDKQDDLAFTFIPKNHQLLDEYLHRDTDNKLHDLLYVTKGFYKVDPVQDGYKISDLRFGSFNGWKGEGEGQFVFTYFVYDRNGSLVFDQKPYRFKPDNAYLTAYIHRVFGM